MKRGFIVLVLFFGLLAPTQIFADSNATKSDANKSVVSTVKNNNSDSLKAAQALLKEMNLEKVYKSAVESSTQRLIRANAKFKKVKDKIKTADELKDITNFYKTKTGKKVLATMGKLSYEGQMITQKKLQPHINELKSLLDSVMKEDENKKAKKSNPKK